jgi:hypothetical protein
MSKAKKGSQPPPAEHEGKGFFALAGEAFAVLGEEIVEGKDKVVEVAAAKITAAKKAIKKITHKKAAPPAKKAVAKAAGVKKKVAKKSAPPAKKAAKRSKATSKKTANKKTAGRKK